MSTTTSKSTSRRAASVEFWELTAADLMTTPVMTIPHDTPLCEAARQLQGIHVSGAPVINEEGQCLGVISSSDFIAWAGNAEAPGGAETSMTCFIAPWGEVIDVAESAEDSIEQYMKSPPITVAPTASIGELTQLMADSHIHRVIVAGEKGLPHGIVTSTDVLAAVARSAVQSGGPVANR